MADRLAIRADVATLGIADPVPGQEKRLDIDWSLDGVKQQKLFFVEDTVAMLPPATHDEWTAGKHG